MFALVSDMPASEHPVCAVQLKSMPKRMVFNEVERLANSSARVKAPDGTKISD